MSCGYGRLLQHGPALTQCEVTGKQRHASRSLAKRHARHLKRKGCTGNHPYQCQHCDGWHIGHPKRRYSP